jgi:hypothetical protein
MSVMSFSLLCHSAECHSVVCKSGDCYNHQTSIHLNDSQRGENVSLIIVISLSVILLNMLLCVILLNAILLCVILLNTECYCNSRIHLQSCAINILKFKNLLNLSLSAPFVSRG